MTEYASVAPLRRYSTKRTHEGEFKEPELLLESHVRWISLTDFQLLLCCRRNDDFKNIDQAVKKLEELQEHEKLKRSKYQSTTNIYEFGLMNSDIGSSTEIAELKDIITIGQRWAEVKSFGELFLPVSEYYTDVNHRYYKSSEREFGTSLIFASSLDFLKASRELPSAVGNPLLKRTAIPLTFFIGKLEVASLYSVNREVQIPPGVHLVPGPAFFQEFFTARRVSKENIYSKTSL